MNAHAERAVGFGAPRNGFGRKDSDEDGITPIRMAALAVAVVWLVGITLAAGDSESPRNSPGTPMNRTAGAPSANTAAGRSLLLIPGLRPLAQQSGPSGQVKPQLAEDVFKNIQVLKGATADEFMGTMGLMAAALGYCCANCHTGAGTQFADWGDDSIREKRVSRRMVTMVQTINQMNFNGRQVVTCWTCHRGRDVPVQTPAMDSVYSEPTVELDDVLARAPGVPPVDRILDKYIQAIGGAQSVAAIRSISARGKSVYFGGFGGNGQVEFYAQAPDKRAVHIHFPDNPERGDSTRTFDGRTGWVATPLAVLRKYELTGGELDGARIEAQLSFPAQIKQTLTNLRVGPPTDVKERDVYVIQGNGARNSLANLYFDKDSGLLVRLVRMTPSAIGRVPTQTDYADYRDVNGVKMPFHITFSWLDGVDTIELTDIQVNTPIDATKFGEPNPGGKTFGTAK